MKTHARTLLATLTASAMIAGTANAAVMVTPGNITTGSLTGSGLIIDTPTTYLTTPYTGADLGWSYTAGTIGVASGQSGWEPSGSTDNSPLFHNGTASWTFDLADGVTINAVYAVWDANGSIAGATYSYSEGADSGDSGFRAQSSTSDKSNGDLVYESANFESLITGPITVAGGDGFKITATSSAFFLSDAVLIDYTVPEPGSLALLGLGGLLIASRRRRS